MLGTVLKYLHLLPHFILTENLYYQTLYYYPHFIVRKMKLRDTGLRLQPSFMHLQGE